MLSLPQKMKEVNVELAGHFQPLEHFKGCQKLVQELLKLFLNSNSSTAHKSMATMGATAAG